MEDKGNILYGIETATDSNPSQEDYMELMRELQKTQKQLRKASKKVKHLKAERRELRQALEQAKCIEPGQQPAQPPYHGRWDRIIEKSLPEGIKLATALVNGSRRYPTRLSKKGEVRYLPPGYPFYPPYKQPLYLPPLTEEGE